MKTISIFIFSFIIVNGAGAQVVINEVFYDAEGDDTGCEWIELYNKSDQEVDLSGYELCARSSGGNYRFESFVLPGHAFVLLHWNSSGTNRDIHLYTGTSGMKNISNSRGSIALFGDSTHTADSICDFMQWGEGSHTFESLAVTAEIWTDEDFVPCCQAGFSLEYDGYGDSSSDWMQQINPTPGKTNVLPIELSVFNAKVEGPYVTLKWTTLSELNNLGFYVLRSETEEGEYVQVSGLINGAGTSVEEHHYAFVDTNVVKGATFWYKLKQVDKDGRFELYGPIKIVLTGVSETLRPLFPQKSTLVCNYPNPFNPGTRILFAINGQKSIETRIFIYNILGRRICALLHELLFPGEYEYKWDGIDEHGNQVPSGIYFCCMKTAEEQSMIKMIKK